MGGDIGDLGYNRTPPISREPFGLSPYSAFVLGFTFALLVLTAVLVLTGHPHL